MEPCSSKLRHYGATAKGAGRSGLRKISRRDARSVKLGNGTNPVRLPGPIAKLKKEEVLMAWLNNGNLYAVRGDGSLHRLSQLKSKADLSAKPNSFELCESNNGAKVDEVLL